MSTPFEREIGSLESKYACGLITEAEFQNMVAEIVPADEVWYYMDAAVEARQAMRGIEK